MAIYCPQCGKELPDDANFCMKCGKPLTGGTQPTPQQEPLWEYCTTGKRQVKDGGIFHHSEYVMAARAVNPLRGTYDVAESDRFIDHQGIPDEKLVPYFDQLVKQLTADGWVLLPPESPWWYSRKFRRRVR